MNLLKKIHSYLKKLSWLKFIIVVAIGNFLLGNIIGSILGGIELPKNITDLSITLEFISVVIIAPFLETLIFQGFIIEVLLRIDKLRKKR